MIIKNHDSDIQYTLNILDSSGNKIIINSLPYYQVLAYTEDSRVCIAVTDYLDSSNNVTFDGSIIECLTKGQLKFNVGMSDVDPKLKDGLYNTNKQVLTNIYYNSDENVDASVSATWSSIRGNILEQEDLVELINSRNNVFALKVLVDASFAAVDASLKELDEDIIALDSSVSSAIETLDSSVSNSIKVLNSSVTKSIDNLNSSVGNTVKVLNSSVSSAILKLNDTVDSSLKATNKEIYNREKTLEDNINSSLNKLRNDVNSSLNVTTTTIYNREKTLEDNINTSLNTISNKLNSSMSSLENKVNSSLIAYKKEVDGTVTQVATNKSNISDLSTNLSNYKVTVNSELSKLNSSINKVSSDLNTSINKVKQDVNSSLGNYYTKTEIDDKGYLTEETDPVWNAEKDNYYTKEHIDASFNNIKLDGYVTEEEFDSSLNNYYTKTELINKMGDASIVKTDYYYKYYFDKNIPLSITLQPRSKQFPVAFNVDNDTDTELINLISYEKLLSFNYVMASLLNTSLGYYVKNSSFNELSNRLQDVSFVKTYDEWEGDTTWAINFDANYRIYINTDVDLTYPTTEGVYYQGLTGVHEILTDANGYTSYQVDTLLSPINSSISSVTNKADNLQTQVDHLIWEGTQEEYDALEDKTIYKIYAITE